mgnify:CR=1 FL=1
MGYNFATDLAGFDVTLEQKLAWHLQYNHYPPVPTSMVQPCIDAIDAYAEWDCERLIELPEGVLWRDQTSAPAYAIVEAHHLDPFIDDDSFEEFEE